MSGLPLVPALRTWSAAEPAEAATAGGPSEREVPVTWRVEPGDSALSDHSPEAYRLRSTGEEVVVTAATELGLRRARGILAQLGVGERAGGLSLGEGEWWPDYPVRGLVLDVGRRFVAPEYVRDLLRQLARFGLNTLLLHLNDNEITSLTHRPWEQAQRGFRLRSSDPAWARLASEQAYTRSDWDSFEGLAAELGIAIVPEFDTPAHSLALLEARPDLALDGGDMFDLAQPASTTFVCDLFDAFLDWFAGPAVHIGADEYAKDAEPHYRRHVREVTAHLRDRGRQVWWWGSLAGMGSAAEHYDTDTVVCAWNDEWYGLAEALADGFDVVNLHDGSLYVVPYAEGYYHRDGLDVADLYARWAPHVAGPEHSVSPLAPGLLGAMASVWNDTVDADYDEATMLDLIRPALPVIAQKCAGGAHPTWEELCRRAEDAAPVHAETAWGRGPIRMPS